MIENKFRGLRKVNFGIPGWVYGEVHYLSKRPHIHIGPDGRKEIVKPETITASSGLHDKKGREIYEGDIVRWYQIEYNSDCDQPLEPYLKEFVDEVVFCNGCFITKENVCRMRPLCAYTQERHLVDEIMKKEFKRCFNLQQYKLTCPTADDLWFVEIIGNKFEHHNTYAKLNFNPENYDTDLLRSTRL